MAKATGRFIDLLSKAIRRKGAGIAWLWVHEGGKNEGGHCHMIAHIPAKLVPLVTRSQKRWLRLITGVSYQKAVIKSRPIGWLLGTEISNPVLHAENLWRVVAYIVKGATNHDLERFGFRKQKPGGLVVGKRCGTSQNIGAKARREFCGLEAPSVRATHSSQSFAVFHVSDSRRRKEPKAKV